MIGGLDLEILGGRVDELGQGAKEESGGSSWELVKLKEESFQDG